jgi:guanylate kinase
MNHARGRLVVISGPSGAGKTSVCRALKQHPEVEFSVSATTRERRRGEVDGVDYHFLSRDDFQRRLGENQFLEWASYNGNLYGTPRWPMDAALARGKVFLVEIEVKGTRQLRERGIPGLYVFIAPPSIDELRRRLERRGSNEPAEIAARVAIAVQEIEAARDSVGGMPLYDVTIVNDDLAATIARVEQLLWP